MLTIIDIKKETTFAIYMNNHAASVRIFDTMFEFLHRQYFSRVIFEPIYLFEHKTVIMSNNLELLEFQDTSEELRPSLKHREKIIDWSTLINRAKLNAFLWLTSFLRIFILDRVEHVLKLKKTYLVEVSVEPKQKKSHDDEIEECDENLFKKKPLVTRSKKLTIQRKWVKKATFDWNTTQQQSFKAIKQSIINNAMTEADSTAQYHLVIDASKKNVSEVFFQLKRVFKETEATLKFLLNERIVMFLSFKLENAEIRYFNSKRECLAVIKCLTEVKWLIIENDHSVMIYSNHEALKFIFVIENTDQTRIADWMNRLGKYDLKLVYRSSRDQHIEIADELSKMFTRLTFIMKAQDSKRLMMTASVITQKSNQRYRSHISLIEILVITEDSRIDKYWSSLMYKRLVKFLQKKVFVLKELNRNRRRHII